MDNNFDLVQTLFLGLQDRLTKAFNLKDPPVFTMSNDPIHYLSFRVRNNNENIKYPMTYLMPRTLAELTSSYSAGRLAKSPYGIVYGTGPDDSILEMRIMPVEITAEFFYLTDDPMRFLSFTSNWMLLSKSGDLNFQLEWFGLNLDIQARTEPTIGIPEKDMASDTLDFAAAQGNIIMNGYVQKILRIEEQKQSLINQDQLKFEIKDYFQLSE